MYEKKKETKEGLMSSNDIRWNYCKPEETLDKILNFNCSAFSNDTANPELEPEARKEILKEINEQYSGSDSDEYAD